MTATQAERTDAQRMIHTLARQFVEQEVLPNIRERDHDEQFTVEVMRKMGEVGLLGSTIPAEYGGAGMDHLSLALVYEETCRASPSIFTSVNAQMALAASSIYRWGREEQKRTLLPELLSGRKIGGFALTEPDHGSDPANMETRATRSGDSWAIDGNKLWITNGVLADLLLVFAQTDASRGYRGIGCFIVEKGTPGCSPRTITAKMGMHGSDTAQIAFQECRVPSDHVLGEVGQGFYIAMSALDEARLASAAGAVGILQGCLDACVNYARSRQQFGKPIGGHQLIQEIVADIATDLEASRGLVERTAQRADSGERFSHEASMAKLFATEAAVRAARNAIQLHGSYGYSSDYPVERYLRDAIAMAIYDGTTQILKLLVARDILGIAAF